MHTSPNPVGPNAPESLKHSFFTVHGLNIALERHAGYYVLSDLHMSRVGMDLDAGTHVHAIVSKNEAPHDS